MNAGSMRSGPAIETDVEYQLSPKSPLLTSQWYISVLVGLIAVIDELLPFSFCSFSLRVECEDRTLPVFCLELHRSSSSHTFLAV